MRKIIMRNTWFILVFFMFGAITYAQEGFHKISVGAELALPLGDFGDLSSIGFGASGKVYYGLNQEMNITGSLGYLNFPYKESDISGGVSMIPLMFGFDYDFGNGFYVEPKLGLMFTKVKVTFMGHSGTVSDTKFGLGLGGGYRFNEWDFSLHYNIVDHLNFLGIRAAYSFDI